MMVKYTKNLVEQIEDVLVFNKGMTQGSAITQAVAYVLFNQHSSHLVNSFDKPKELNEAITEQMLSVACKFVVGEVERFIK
jgi:hypothetical protein